MQLYGFYFNIILLDLKPILIFLQKRFYHHEKYNGSLQFSLLLLHKFLFRFNK